MRWLLVSLMGLLAGGSSLSVDVPAGECNLMAGEGSGRAIEYKGRAWEAQPCFPASVSLDKPATVPIWGRSDPARWGYASFGDMLGASGVLVAEVPPVVGWAPAEIYVGGSTTSFGSSDYWHALRFSEMRQAFEDVFVSQTMPSRIARLDMANVIGDPQLEIVAALRSGEIMIYDQVTKRALPGFWSGLSDPTLGMALRDLDGDDKAEVVLSSATHLRVLTGSGDFRWELDVGGEDVTVGQMDADPSLEIALSSRSVVDADSRSVQWTWPPWVAGMFDVESVDMDGDGMDELIAAPHSGVVFAWDVDTESFKWSLPLAEFEPSISAIRLANLDEDPALELLVSQSSLSKLDVYDTKTLTREWTLTTDDGIAGGISYVGIGKLRTGRGTKLVFGSGLHSTGEDHLYVVDLETRSIEWRTLHLDGPFIGSELGDVDGDGRPELVFASRTSNARYDPGRVVVLDATTHAVRAIAPPNIEYLGIHDLRLRNVDDDAALEILVATDHFSAGVIRIYDFDGETNSFSESWTNLDRPDGPLTSVEVADLDADGDLEVIAGAWGAVHVFDLASGSEEWQASDLGYPYVRAIAVLLGAGGHPHLAALSGGDGAIHVFDGVTAARIQIIEGTFSALGVTGSPHGRSLLAGTTDGLLRRYEPVGNGYVLAASQAAAPMRIDGIHSIDKSLVAVGQGGSLSLYRWDSLDPLWTSSNYGAGLGRWLARDSTYWYSAGNHAVVAFSPRHPVTETAWVGP
jgi:hypothetical protein